MSDSDRKIISEPKGNNPEITGLSVSRGSQIRGEDIEISNFFSHVGTVTTVYVSDEEIEDLIDALEELKRGDER